MSLTFIPKSIFRVRFFTRPSRTVDFVPTEKAAYAREGFYYIGNDAGSIDQLVQVYERGYAAGALAAAKKELQQTLATHAIPEIIFCEKEFDTASIRKFSDFLKGHPVLSSVPFIVNNEGFPVEMLASLKTKR
jgi:hypothetical protein